MKEAHIKSPTKKEKFTLRLMIFLGLIGMVFFLKSLFNSAVIANPILYWMLVSGIVFACLTILHEWYHYFYITIPETPPQIKIYTVDIFTTFCAGEPHEMIVETLTAIQQITYPHQTYLCDEANDPYLVELCKNLGVNHVTRVLKVDAKAGNINNALKQSTGELCVVLDPDHVPFPNFLNSIVTHFNNPDIGFVQIVQAYKNNDDSLIAKGAAQQTFQFYGPMMMTMNKYGTVLAIGANCTFRRKALDSIGGHAAGLAEDMHTAMQLHAKGWKSVYVPHILARGLVPSTLSAYYSQQLKWSRGVFELWVATYPKLFKKFTWRQKLHYFSIPIHYLSGIIFLLNFLVPIIALTFSISPLKMEIEDFCFIGLPFLAAIILIRHFVQWWVMEDDERGFHVVGGLLMIGTWWIYILGFFYTILRKKVPYNPTPKDGNEANNWPLNLPNIVVLFLSIFAIVYGLVNDYNPYNIMMAGFAGLNCLIMLFTIVASRQIQFRLLRARYPHLDAIMENIHLVKKSLWLMRRRIYTGVRSTALLLTTLITCITLYFINDTYHKQNSIVQHHQEAMKVNFQYGLFSPEKADGLPSMALISQFQKRNSVQIKIVSLYLPWGDQQNSFLPAAKLDSIYEMGAIPMITWEPWQSLFSQNRDIEDKEKEKKVLFRIQQGDYDAYLKKFSDQVKGLQHPVYLRFAHEADNPFYPWSKTGGNSAADFKGAWKYIHHYFTKNEVYNVIWVWNPWKPEAVNDYFPGKKYVDWIGVTNLNYGDTDGGRGWYAMNALYAPFHKLPVFQSGLPVMLAEMGSSKSAGRQSEWFNLAINSIAEDFPEIKALVLFNSGLDKNVPQRGKNQVIDWRIAHPDSITKFFKYNTKIPGESPFLLPKLPLTTLIAFAPESKTLAAIQNSKFKNVKGVNYTKGLNWEKSKHPFRKVELLQDFKEIKKVGLNTIRRYGPGVYDYNIFKAAKAFDLNIQYGFWIPDQLDFIKDTEKLDRLAAQILTTIKDYRQNKQITSWNIGNPAYQQLKYIYLKPDLIYQQNAYLTWLKKLIVAIKNEDSSRPVTVEIEIGEDLLSTANAMRNFIPAIDSYGLILSDKNAGNTSELINSLQVPYYFSKADVTAYFKQKRGNEGFFISSWQDEETSDWVTLNGLKDLAGRNKLELFNLRNHLTGMAIPAFPKVKILRPATSISQDATLTYYALVQINGKWQAATESLGYKWEWKLVKNNNFKDPINIKSLGEGTHIQFNAPANPSSYKLYLFVVNGQSVKIISSPLNTPLYETIKRLRY